MLNTVVSKNRGDNMKGIQRWRSGFSLVELIVTIVIIGILVMLGIPKLMGYVEKAELARIQHDVKIMEDKMAEDSINGVKNFVDWDDNAKDLGLLVLADLLYETEGKAKSVAKPRTQYGDVASSGDILSEVEIDSDYKIIPEEMSEQIKTTLPGTFYTNMDGKVYYEHDKPLTRVKEYQEVACESALPDYTFEHETGTIVKYHGDAQHLIIPPAFNVDGRCYPVLIIGKGAFMHGNYREVIVPEGVVTIEDETFYDVELQTIIIPSSVTNIRDEIFKDSIINNIIINNSKNNVTVGDKVNSGGYRSPGYSPEDGGSSGTNDGSSDSVDAIVTSNGIGYGGGYTGSGNGTVGSSGIASINNSSSINGNIEGNTNNRKKGRIYYNVVEANFNGSNSDSGNKGIVIKDHIGFSDGVIVIPSTINIDGEDIPVVIINKGVYQGKGLISVVLPNGLKAIEDYAFAGNQLVLINIPSSVEVIGNYAFAFNETVNQKNFKPAIKEIIILSHSDKNWINDLDRYGNIKKDSKKASQLGQTKLLDFIFVTSKDNFIINVDNTVNSVGRVSSYTDNQLQVFINDGYIPIASQEDLNAIRSNVNHIFAQGTKWEKEISGGLDNYYIQVVDIDLLGQNFIPIGDDNNRFIGIYNGGNFKITNLTINRPSASYNGLIGFANESTIENVGLVDINIKGSSSNGGLIGMNSRSTIRNSYSTGIVTGTGNATGGLIGDSRHSTIIDSYSITDVTGGNVYTGGLVGLSVTGSIIDSYSVGTVKGKDRTGGLTGWITNNNTIENSFSVGTVTGANGTGGLVGCSVNNSEIKNSYSKGAVIGTERVGGLVGWLYNNSMITNSYSVGQISGKSQTGGLVGYLDGGKLVNSYYNREISNINDSGKGFGKTKIDMQSKNTYNGWNFNTIWRISTGGYPNLQWSK